jgi:hypothetical protein
MLGSSWGAAQQAVSQEAQIREVSITPIENSAENLTIT